MNLQSHFLDTGHGRKPIDRARAEAVLLTANAVLDVCALAAALPLC